MDDGACAICLEIIPPADVALVKTCLHAFCAPCIVRWTSFQLDNAAKRLRSPSRSSDPTCPCCKVPFSSLLTYRTLDGRLTEDLREESACLLRRARWLPSCAKTEQWERDQGATTNATTGGAGSYYEGFYEEDFVYDEDYLDDEEEYMHRARGRGGSRGCRGGGAAAPAIGNRRYGPNGYIAQGQRMLARPVPAEPARTKGGRAGKRGKAKGGVGGEGASAAASSPSPSPSLSPSTSTAIDVPGTPATPSTGDVASSSPLSPSTSTSTSTPGNGRGKKSAKRAEAKAKKEEKEALRRSRRVENAAAAAAAAKAKASLSGSLKSQLPDLPDFETKIEEAPPSDADADEIEPGPPRREFPAVVDSDEEEDVFSMCDED